MDKEKATMDAIPQKSRSHPVGTTLLFFFSKKQKIPTS